MADIKSKYTDNQIKIMLAMLEDMASEGTLKCNWDNVAMKAGCKTGNSARVTWGNIKMGLQKNDGSTASAPPTPTPKTPRKRKAKGEDDDDGTIAASSAKKGKGAKAAEGANDAGESDPQVKEEDD